MTQISTIRFRLLRDSAEPPSHDGSVCHFGVQDSKGQLYPPVTRADGWLVFEFELKVSGSDAARPAFSGAFASGPKGARFVYLSWARPRGGYVNRVKVRLSDIDWATVRSAQDMGKVLEAEMSGRKPGGGTVPVVWRLAEA